MLVLKTKYSFNVKNTNRKFKKKKIRTCHKNEENVQKMIKVCSATV